MRSPGAYFEKAPDRTSDKDIYSARVIPSRGAWFELEIDKRDQVGVRLDRKRKQSVTVLLKALGWTESKILAEFGQYDSIRATLEKDSVKDRDEALLDIYRKLRPGEPPTVEAAQALLDNMYFTPRRYDLAKVGRYKLNRKLGVDVPMDSPEASVLSQDDIAQMIRYLCALHAGETSIPGVRDGEEISLKIDIDDIDHFGNRRIRTVGELIENQIRTGLSRMERVVSRAHDHPGRGRYHPAVPGEHPPRRGGYQGVFRYFSAVAVHGPEQPAGRSDPQASSVRTGPGRSVP